MSGARVPVHNHSGFLQGGKLELSQALSADEAGSVGGSSTGDVTDVATLHTAETDTTTRLAPDGLGGVDWVAEGALTVEDEGTPLATAADTLNFVGAGVTATGSGATKTITIPGGGSDPNAEMNIEGGQDVIKAHGSMGATETFDPTDGNVHTGTLDANCTVTLAAPAGSGACSLEFWLTEDGTGGWTVTWPGSVTEEGTHDTTLSTTQRVIVETIDGGTTWIATWIGGGSTLTDHTHATSGTGPTGGGGTLNPAVFTFPAATSPAQTADGSAVWDSDDDKLTVGTGAARQTLVNEGAVTTSGLTQATGKILGRSTASTGAIEEITVGTNLTLSAGTLSATGGGTTATDMNIWRPLMDGGGNVVTDGSGQAVMAWGPA